MSAAARRAAPVAAGLLADRLLGEPPGAWHPVAGFGRAMQTLEAWCYRDSRRRGVLYAAAGIGGSALVGLGPGRCRSPLIRTAATAAATYLCVAEQALERAASDVADPLAAGNLDTARLRLRSLVGRDPANLDESEIARAVVESVAENAVDAVVAPAVWALVGGAPAVLAYRATNTLDAMVGHRSARYGRFGWAAARSDDAANWIPARLTAALVVAVRPRRAPEVWRAVRLQAPGHPSPNAGVAEAAFAAALGVRLGGVNDYDGILERRPDLGFGAPAGVGDIDRARTLLRHVTGAMAAVLCVVAAGRARR